MAQSPYWLPTEMHMLCGDKGTVRPLQFKLDNGSGSRPMMANPSIGQTRAGTQAAGRHLVLSFSA